MKIFELYEKQLYINIHDELEFLLILIINK